MIKQTASIVFTGDLAFDTHSEKVQGFALHFLLYSGIMFPE